MSTPATSSVNDDAGVATPPGAFASAGTRVADAAGTAKNATVDAYASASKTVSSALDEARQRVSSAYDSTRESAADLRSRTADGIDASPALALVGGLALGAIVAALLPRSEREVDALRALGGRINEAAHGAMSAGTEAGRDKLGELGLDQDHARETVSKLIGNVIAAATSAGTAAASAVREPGPGR